MEITIKLQVVAFSALQYSSKQVDACVRTPRRYTFKHVIMYTFLLLLLDFNLNTL